MKEQREQAKEQRKQARVEIETEDEEDEPEESLFTSFWGIADPDEPSEKEALSGPDEAHWRAAMREELEGIKEMGVYELVPRSSVPKGRKIMKGRMVFRKKRNAGGYIMRYKAHWVVKGYAGVFGQDYTKTTSPTARLESLRVLLHIGASMDWDIQQMDVKTAYLYGLLEEECWMEQPEGFREQGKEDWVWALKRGLYGMKKGDSTA